MQECKIGKIAISLVKFNVQMACGFSGLFDGKADQL
jgi:hypothetical protein